MSHFENLIEKICLVENLEFPLWYMKLLQSNVIFKQKKNHEVSCDYNFCMEIFTTHNSKNVIVTRRIVTIEKLELCYNSMEKYTHVPNFIFQTDSSQKSVPWCLYFFFKKSWVTLDHLCYVFHHNCMSLSF